ncbi:MAG: aminomethyl-transferring glycine dehydrogenase subunit GcvPB [Planctomycetota bacterium]
METTVIFEKSKQGRRAVLLPALDVPASPLDKLIPQQFLRKEEPHLPEVGEVEIVRHYTRLSHKNVGVDTNFYPLGSCTMKWNPKINELLAALTGFARVHPYQPEQAVQGTLELLYLTSEYLKQISGLPAVSLQPAAGAHGEMTGVLIMRTYHEDRGEKRTKILIPDSAHGTNPASAVICGFKPVEVKSDARGNVDLSDLSQKCDKETVGLMLTIPSTLGLFDNNMVEIGNILHEKGALLYMDGANLNAIMGIVRPGECGVDVMHFNLHKTFSTPHGMGGPGSGPIAVSETLSQFLPVPLIIKQGDKFSLNYDVPKSIGKMKSWYGNIAVIVKAFSYILSLGSSGVRRVSEIAVLNANYLMAVLKKYYYLKYDRFCMHEFVLSGNWQKKFGVKTLDISKRLLDKGYHPPTNYFPLIVEEALMIEPTENESLETLDGFADAMIEIAKEAAENPQLLLSAPSNMPIGRPDEVKAAREPIMRWQKK